MRAGEGDLVAIIVQAVDIVVQRVRAGEGDLVAMLRAKDHERPADIVTDRMLKLDAIVKSQTLIAFGAYSKHDLEAMFSLVLES